MRCWLCSGLWGWWLPTPSCDTDCPQHLPGLGSCPVRSQPGLWAALNPQMRSGAAWAPGTASDNRKTLPAVGAVAEKAAYLQPSRPAGRLPPTQASWQALINLMPLRRGRSQHGHLPGAAGPVPTSQLPQGLCWSLPWLAVRFPWMGIGSGQERSWSDPGWGGGQGLPPSGGSCWTAWESTGHSSDPLPPAPDVAMSTQWRPVPSSPLAALALCGQESGQGGDCRAGHLPASASARMMHSAIPASRRQKGLGFSLVT